MENELKDRIRKLFGSIAQLAFILGAPKQTLYAWTRKAKNNPSAWIVEASIDAGIYRSKSVKGWSCQNCGNIIEANNVALKPPYCCNCAANSYTPVSIIHVDNHAK